MLPVLRKVLGHSPSIPEDDYRLPSVSYMPCFVHHYFVHTSCSRVQMMCTCT